MVGTQGLSQSAPAASLPEKESPYHLGELINLALKNNPATRVAWQRSAAAAAEVGESKAAYWPRLLARFDGGSDRSYTPAAPGPDQFTRVQATVTLALEYLLFDFGKRDAEVSRTVARLEAAGLLYQREMQRTVFAVQRAWFVHEAALWQAKAAEVELLSARTTLATVESEATQGLSAVPEVLTAKKHLLEAQYLQESAESLVQKSRGALCVASGLPANTNLRIATTSRPEPSSELRAKADDLIQRALAMRPDLEAKAAAIREAEASQRRARAEFLPDIRLAGGYTYSTFGYEAESASTGGTYRDNLNGYGAFLVASWDIFDGFARTHRLNQTKHETEARREDYREKSLSVTLDVWDSYYSYLDAGSRLAYVEAWSKAAEESLSAIQAAFSSGISDITEVEKMRSLAARARYEVAAAVAEVSTATAALALALGQAAPQSTPSLTAP